MSRLSLTTDAPELQVEKKSVHNCWICRDNGFVEYERIVEGRKYPAMAHCICEAGNKFKYNGQLCEDKKSTYHMPCITDFFPLEYLQEEAELNRAEYEKFNERKEK